MTCGDGRCLGITLSRKGCWAAIDFLRISVSVVHLVWHDTRTDAVQTRLRLGLPKACLTKRTM